MLKGIDWLPSELKLREVGPREGFQSISTAVPTETKIKIVDKLTESGLKRINAVSFVHPKVNPQVADAEDVIRGMKKKKGVSYSTLILNMKGLERAVAIRDETGCPDEIHFLAGTTEAIYRANRVSEKSLFEYLNDIGAMIVRANDYGFKTSCFVSAAFGCSIEGPVEESHMLRVAHTLADFGPHELTISDSTGQATPVIVFRRFSLVKQEFGDLPIAAHFHDARGAGLANILVLMGVGIKNLTIDCSFGGLGGVPAMPGAVGNVSTEDLVSMCDGMGIKTGVDIKKVLAASKMAEEVYGKVCPSRVLRVGLAIWEK